MLVNAVAPYGSDIAECLRIPSIGMFLQPMEPSAAYPPVATLSALRAGPAPIPRSRMTVSRLTAAITAAVNTPAYLHNARQIASRLAGEDGATGILTELEHTVTAP